MTVDLLDRRQSDEASVRALPVEAAPARERRALAGRVASNPSACAAGAARAGYRMSRWERLSLSVAVLLALVVGSISLLSPSSQPTRDITVQPGDTVLSVVLRELPEWETVRAGEVVRAINSLTDEALAPGMTIRVPVAP